MSMLKQNKRMIMIFLLLGMILLGLGNATVTITDGANVNEPVCPSPGTSEENLDTQSEGSSTLVDYTATSSFYDHTNNEYSQIMVLNGSNSNPFKFVYFDTKSIKQEAVCTGTAGFTFLRLINNLLFLKKTTPSVEFYVCQFDSSIIENSVTTFSTKRIMVPSTLLGEITKFIPYSVRETTQGNEWDIYILFSNSSTQMTTYYEWSQINTGSNVITSTISSSFTIFDGIQDVIYNDVDGFAIKSSGAYTPDTNILAKPNSGSIVRFYRTLSQTGVIVVYASDLLTASFYIVQKKSASIEISILSSITTSSTSAFVDYFDDSSNVILISSTQVVWINVALDGTAKKVFATTTEIPTTNLQSIGFLGTRAVFTYSDKLVTYEITGDDALTKTFSHSTTTPIILSSTDYQKIFALSCFCRILRTIVCYSSTLNCLLISKGTANCPAEVSLVPN